MKPFLVVACSDDGVKCLALPLYKLHTYMHTDRSLRWSFHLAVSMDVAGFVSRIRRDRGFSRAVGFRLFTVRPRV